MGALGETLRGFNLVSMVLRLLLALAAGGVLGYGRSKKHKNAGLRTYILVSMGAALTVLITFYERAMLDGAWAFAAETAELKYDGLRIGAHVITGIGFLAAGTIIGIEHRQVSGLTTAIGLFAAACMGLAAGAGFYEGVLAALVLIIIVMEIMGPLEIEFKRKLRNITIHVEFGSLEDIDRITGVIREQDAQIFDIDLETSGDPERGESPSAILSLKLSRDNASHSAILSSVAELPCVSSIQELIS